MAEFTAEYAAPSATPKTFKQALPTCSKQPTTEERTAYLTSLRTSITGMQHQINAFLTQKMEEDNQKAGTAAVTDDDAKEEENYGEEAVEDD
jgi:hypothetical protein